MRKTLWKSFQFTVVKSFSHAIHSVWHRISLFEVSWAFVKVFKPVFCFGFTTAKWCLQQIPIIYRKSKRKFVWLQALYDTYTNSHPNWIAIEIVQSKILPFTSKSIAFKLISMCSPHHVNSFGFFLLLLGSNIQLKTFIWIKLQTQNTHTRI